MTALGSTDEGLSPCPFCGGKSIVFVYPFGHSIQSMKCKACGVTTAAFPFQEEAVAAWNRRCDHDAKLAALRLVNDKHGSILEASVHDAVLACLGLKAHPNGTGYGYQSDRGE